MFNYLCQWFWMGGFMNWLRFQQSEYFVTKECFMGWVELPFVFIFRPNVYASVIWNPYPHLQTVIELIHNNSALPHHVFIVFYADYDGQLLFNFCIFWSVLVNFKWTWNKIRRNVCWRFSDIFSRKSPFTVLSEEDLAVYTIGQAGGLHSFISQCVRTKSICTPTVCLLGYLYTKETENNNLSYVTLLHSIQCALIFVNITFHLFMLFIIKVVGWWVNMVFFFGKCNVSVSGCHWERIVCQLLQSLCPMDLGLFFHFIFFSNTLEAFNHLQFWNFLRNKNIFKISYQVISEGEGKTKLEFSIMIYYDICT